LVGWSAVQEGGEQHVLWVSAKPMNEGRGVRRGAEDGAEDPVAGAVGEDGALVSGGKDGGTHRAALLQMGRKQERLDGVGDDPAVSGGTSGVAIQGIASLERPLLGSRVIGG
jgi:hypothetical protein